MPELPEVETIVRDLRPRLQGRRLRVRRVGRRALRRRWRHAWDRLLQDRRIDAVRRRGKWIVLDLDSGAALVFHLGMTGQLTAVDRTEPLARHTHLIFALDDGRDELRFRDIRRFGCALCFARRDDLAAFFHDAGLGPEPFDIDAGSWHGRLQTTRRCLKAVLLDQRVVAGVGNIYADEALFEAKLHPARAACDLNAAQARRLRDAVVTVLTRAIDRRGSSIRDYVDGNGDEGSYQREFRVYGQYRQPCPRCGRAINRMRLAGRATHFCPRCQPPCG